MEKVDDKNSPHSIVMTKESGEVIEYDATQKNDSELYNKLSDLAPQNSGKTDRVAVENLVSKLKSNK